MFRKLLEVADKILEVSCVVLLLVAVGLTAGQVFWRYVLDDPLTWSEELARLVFIYVTFLSAALAIRRRRMLRITVLVDSLPPRVRHALDLVTHILVGIFLVIVVVQSQVIVSSIGNHEAPATGIQLSIFYLSLPVASIAMLLYLVEQVVESYRGLRDGTPVRPSHHVHSEVSEEPVAMTAGHSR